MKRDYYQDIGYKPFLFYLVFGVSAEELEVSQKRHKVDELPEGLDIRSFTREAQGEWIDGWFSGAYGSVMREADAVLFERCKAAENCVVLQGTIKNDSTLDYMRNVIGIIQAFVDGSFRLLSIKAQWGSWIRRRSRCTRRSSGLSDFLARK